MRPSSLTKMRSYGSERQKSGNEIFTEDDMYIIVGIATGMTHEQAGEFLATVRYPNGVSGRCVRNWQAAKREIYDRAILRIASRWKQLAEEFRQITRDELRGELEKLRHKAVRVKDKVLDHALTNASDTAALTLGDRAADSLIDRDLGRAAQTHRLEGKATVEHNLRIWGMPQPAGRLAAQDRDMEDSDDLLASVPAEVLEAEVVQ